jgi:hypothetical protein
MKRATVNFAIAAMLIGVFGATACSSDSGAGNAPSATPSTAPVYSLKPEASPHMTPKISPKNACSRTMRS